MEQSELKQLRPMEMTVEAIQASLAAIDAAVADRQAKAGPLADKRAAALLTLGTKEIAAIEAEQAAIRIDIDQLAALRSAVDAELPAAQQRADHAALVAQRAQAAEAVAAFEEFMGGRYADLVALFEEARALERAMTAATGAYRAAAEQVTGSQGGRTWAEGVARAFGPDADPEALRAPGSSLLVASGLTITSLASLPAMPRLTTKAELEARKPAPIAPARPLTAEELSRITRRGTDVRQPGTPAPRGDAEPHQLHPHDRAGGAGWAA